MAAPSSEELKRVFLSVGLEAKSVDQTLNNKKLTTTLYAVLKEANVLSSGCEKARGALLYTVATKLNPDLPIVAANRPLVVQYIVNGKLNSSTKVDAACKYLSKALSFDLKEFEEKSGAGVEVSPQQITAATTALLAEHKVQAAGPAGWGLQFKLVGELNAKLKWADGAAVMAELVKQLTAACGPKPDKPVKAPAAEKKDEKKDDKPAKKEEKKGEEKKDEKVEENWDFLDEARDLPEAHNTPAQMQAHLAATGGLFRSRFPPEPNGFLHIGHAKAMRVNYGFAKKRSGHCIMRFDDTNPDAEKKLYIDNILENVKWLGHQPATVTYSSDYFQELYDLAVILIKKGLAYVCHQTKDDIKLSRETKEPSPYRNRPVEENLRLFEDMRKGKFAEGKATLRLKGDLNHPNPQMWDIIAYRIKFTRHPHVGDKWCIYPSYDYSHCIIDSLENITHSMCTLEFEVRRESYFWLLHILDLYKPKVWEYSRLNITYNVMSKRKLKQLVVEKHVRGWDDPRLFTINGLRRRGYTADAINSFCDLVGVSRNANTIEMDLLEHCARQDLDEIASRALVVRNPLKVTLINYPENKTETRDAITNPKTKASRKVPFNRVVYIDQSDFRTEDSKDFYGAAPGKTVHLKYAYNITIQDVKKDQTGKVVELLAVYDEKSAVKEGEKGHTLPKGKLHWVCGADSKTAPLTVELRLYDRLFDHPNPGGEEKWLELINPKSLEVISNAYADPSLANAKPFDKFQFERVGYFSVDPDTATENRLIFNRTVKLKETEKLKAEGVKKDAKKDTKKDTKKDKKAAAK